VLGGEQGSLYQPAGKVAARLRNCGQCCLGVSADLYGLYRFWTLSAQQLGVPLVTEDRALLDGSKAMAPSGLLFANGTSGATGHDGNPLGGLDREALHGGSDARNSCLLR
jgi:hypothetical protein